jgi:DNA mismatch repair protein MutS2
VDIELRTRRSLEWERLKGFLAAESSSQWSRELCLELPTHSETALVKILLAETDEALSMLAAGFGLSQDGLPELREVIGRIGAGSQASGRELLDLRNMLLLCRRTRGALNGLSPEDFPQLSQLVPKLHLQDQLVQDIDDVFDDNGIVKDSASSLLHQLRREVVRLNNQTRDELTRIINSPTHSKALQEPIYTTRNGRYVLPVQASLRHSIQGIVHDSSASGMTVFVEPMAVVELTNKIRLKESEIEREIDRLLSELTFKAQDKIDQIEESYRCLVEVDFIAARARLAQKYKGTLPELSAQTSINFKNARHPLLVLQNLNDPARVIANDIALDTNIRTLVITGPNTGGKTVYLKTAGLLSLMVAAGLLLPVDNGSSAVVFEHVFADIGDEQSIEQSLSTFSSHMTNIVEIVARAKERTLVLLDEVGAGTDPREGAILARVILEHLNASGAFTIATTHYGEMKTLAYTADGFINGSLDFDEATLSPTYRMRIGIPGSSKAITIASRLGLDRRLIDSASQLLSADSSDAQAMIEQLETKLREAQEKQEEASSTLENARRLESQAKGELERLAGEREKLRRGYAGQIETQFTEARDFAKQLIAELQKAPSIKKAQQIQQELEVLRSELGWLSPEEVEQEKRELFVGQTVKVRSLNQKAVIEALPDDADDPKAEVAVRAGHIKIKVPRNDLEFVEGAPTKAQVARGAPVQFKTPNAARPQKGRVSKSDGQLDVFVRTSSNTVDLRGQRVEEALANLERFIDESFLAQLSPVMIIHGHGTGKVRAAVRSFLSNSAYNTNFRPGEAYEGGDGVTVVQFS